MTQQHPAPQAARPAPAPHGRARQRLPRAGHVLAVCAHPDDESCGLGAVLAAFSGQGARVRVLCFTCGEASTLGQAPGPEAAARKGEDFRQAG